MSPNRATLAPDARKRKDLDNKTPRREAGGEPGDKRSRRAGPPRLPPPELETHVLGDVTRGLACARRVNTALIVGEIFAGTGIPVGTDDGPRTRFVRRDLGELVARYVPQLEFGATLQAHFVGVGFAEPLPRTGPGVVSDQAQMIGNLNVGCPSTVVLEDRDGRTHELTGWSAGSCGDSAAMLVEQPPPPIFRNARMLGPTLLAFDGRTFMRQRVDEARLARLSALAFDTAGQIGQHLGQQLMLRIHKFSDDDLYVPAKLLDVRVEGRRYRLRVWTPFTPLQSALGSDVGWQTRVSDVVPSAEGYTWRCIFSARATRPQDEDLAELMPDPRPLQGDTPQSSWGELGTGDLLRIHGTDFEVDRREYAPGSDQKAKPDVLYLRGPFSRALNTLDLTPREGKAELPQPDEGPRTYCIRSDVPLPNFDEVRFDEGYGEDGGRKRVASAVNLAPSDAIEAPEDTRVTRSMAPLPFTPGASWDALTGAGADSPVRVGRLGRKMRLMGTVIGDCGLHYVKLRGPAGSLRGAGIHSLIAAPQGEVDHLLLYGARHIELD